MLGIKKENDLSRWITYFSQLLQKVEYCWPRVKVFCLCLGSDIVWVDSGQQLDDNNGNNTRDLLFTNKSVYVQWDYQFSDGKVINNAEEKNASGIIKCIQLLVRLEFRVTSFLLSVLGSVYMWCLFLAVSYVGKFLIPSTSPTL